MVSIPGLRRFQSGIMFSAVVSNLIVRKVVRKVFQDSKKMMLATDLCSRELKNILANRAKMEK
jgi:hypothetical protein